MRCKKDKKEKELIFKDKKLTEYGCGYVLGYSIFLLSLLFSIILVRIINIYIKLMPIILLTGIFVYGILVVKLTLYFIKKAKKYSVPAIN